MKRSLLAFAVFAAAALAAAPRAVSAIADRCTLAFRRTAAAIADFGFWLVAKLPRHEPDWLAARRQALVVHKDMNPISLRAERRPLISSRWRMCPSI